MVQHYTKKDKARVVADAIGISHFLVANLIMILGQVNSDFKEILTGLLPKYSAYPGIDFVYNFMDKPVYNQIQGIAEMFREDSPKYFWMGAEAVVLLSSAFYGFVAYIVLWIIIKIFR